MSTAEKKEKNLVLVDAHAAVESHEHHDDTIHVPGAHHEEEEGEPWLMSFADMVTLLMCFFILFFSVEPASKSAMTSEEKLTSQLKTVLGYKGIDYSDMSSTAEKAEKNIQARADAVANQQRVDVSFALGFHSINTLEVVLLTSNLFNVGRADLTQVGAELIAKVAEELKTSSLGAQIEVEGHTDSDPLKKSSPFKTNWNLSTARASAIAEMLVKAGIEGSRIRATGYSHFQPLAPEFDDRGFPLTNNKALNRRIVIKLHFPDVAKADSESETNPKPKNINNTDKG